jgi:glucose/arabinose dehydrogenase
MRRTPFVLLLLAATLSCNETPIAPPTGQLSVAIGGLPTGVPAAVVVTGPESFRQTLEASRTLSSLASGVFTIVASDVASGGIRYAPTPALQVVTLGDGAVMIAGAIDYRVASAKLSLLVTGLPASTPASITIAGPRGYSRTVTGATDIELLEPGTYTITAGDVQAGGKTYRAVAKTSVVELIASLTSITATVQYGAGSGSLDVTVGGLPAGTDASINIVGPGGVTRRLTSTSTVGNLEPGSYVVTADVVGSSLTTHRPTPLTQTIDVVDGQTRAAAVVYGSAPLQLGVTLFADGLTQPVFLTAPEGDARQFIVERGGRVRLVVNGSLRPTPFLDIRSRVNNNGERGMLSMAFDPLYATNGFFYVYYVDLGGNVVVERLSSVPGSDVAGASAGIVISIPHGGSEHHGGMIAFGPDGMLYLAPGDGGCCGDPNNNAQNLGTLLGKMLRIDVRSLPYTIPAGNPFVGTLGARAEIWAYGLRNPWRYSFDAPSGMLYIGDVGQDAREELDVARTSDAGLNYGWRYMEGTACYLPSSNCAAGRTLTLPVLDYSHTDGCSITGGYVYRGAAIPELTGHYLFSDYCKGWLKSVRVSGNFARDNTTWSGVVLPGALSFGRDGMGELYMVSGTRVWKIIRPDE